MLSFRPKGFYAFYSNKEVLSQKLSKLEWRDDYETIE